MHGGDPTSASRSTASYRSEASAGGAGSTRSRRLPAAAAPPPRASRRRPNRGLNALVVTALFTLAATAAFASHGSSVINLAIQDAIITHDGAVFAQGGVGAGTGNYDPFLTLSPGGNANTEAGYNQCDDAGCPDDAPPFDQHFGGGNTHELRVSAVPILEYPAGSGNLYREFGLDANDQGSDTWMSVDQIKIYIDDQVDLDDYDDTLEAFGNDSGMTADKVWDLDDDGNDNQTILMQTQGLESGSGVSDITVLVPNDVFPAECSYGAPVSECPLWLYFFTSAGAFTGGDQGVDCSQPGKPGAPCDWNVTAGFEEWRIRFLPVVNVDKTAVPTFDREYDWTVEKTVSDEDIDLFDGDDATVTWSVTPTRGDPVDSNFRVTGMVTVTNPTGDDPIEEEIDATINSLVDILTLNGIDTTVSLNCGGISFPYVLEAGEQLVCSYTQTTPGAADDWTGQNEATATIRSGIPAATGGITFGTTVEYSHTELIDFGTVTPSVSDETATLTDTRMPIDQAAVSGVPVTYQETFECGDDEGSHSNTARVTEDTSGEFDEDGATVDVTCHQLDVAKTVDTSLERTWTWDLEKEADVTEIELFAGDSAQIEWTVTVVGLGSTDAAWHVEGEITVTNPAPIDADDVDVSDAISGFAGTITIDCDDVAAGNQTMVDIPMDSSVTCDYEADLPDGADRTNTATATLFGIGYDSDAEDVDFADATVTEIDGCITVTDDNATPGDTGDDFTFSPDPVCVDDLVGGEYEFDPFTTEVGPFGLDDCDSITVTNTADSVTNDDEVTDSADADVDVTCYELTVTKDADTTYSRDYDWDIEKTRFFAPGEVDGDGLLGTLTLDEGQTFDVSYEVTVTMTGYTDDDHAVTGTITISNPAPMEATGVAVSDVLSHSTDPDILATVDCDDSTLGNQDEVDVPAAVNGTPGEAECAYSADLPDADDRTNTATATLFDLDYTGTALVTFGDPTTLIDECIDVVDDAGTPLDTADDIDLGQVCVDDLDASDQWTDEYTITVGPFEVCGEYTFINTVSFATSDDDNDTTESGSDFFTLVIDVPCPEGCTLTQGYWKTHNDTFWGGAPADDTWFLLGDVDGDTVSEGEGETFFLSGGTYFQAMWTAPKGNVYYNLSRQYIAAILNQLDGAAVPAVVQDAIDDATTLFETYTPAQVAGFKGKTGKDIRAEFVALAGTLAAYNEGDIGPGHCDEDGGSAVTGSHVQLALDRRPPTLG